LSEWANRYVDDDDDATAVVAASDEDQSESRQSTMKESLWYNSLERKEMMGLMMMC
jgi:hypothetical protein